MIVLFCLENNSIWKHKLVWMIIMEKYSVKKHELKSHGKVNYVLLK